ncbi:MAG: hypothetical protein MJE77_11150 [Proteobacteria bacterium]|nr:hypothetical protein [Pseudomonadota bacterium]
MPFITCFRNRFNCKDQEPVNDGVEFSNLMRYAEEIARLRGNEGIIDLQRASLRSIQSYHIIAAYLDAEYQKPDPINVLKDFGIRDTFKKLIDRDGASTDIKIKLGRDTILPTVWNESSLVKTIGVIGENRRCGEFLQSDNHRVIWWIPLHIGWVTNGNHSLAQGILNACGELVPSEVYDLSELYHHARYDGYRFVCIKSGKALGVPRYREFGWAFELGRLIGDTADSVAP